MVEHVGFEVAADAYDAFMGRWSRRLAAPFADFAGIHPGMRILDVGCGTGALTEELLRRLQVHDVEAVDTSSSFVQAVRDRHPGLAVQVAAAEHLPFGDGAFDGVLAQLVVHFLADPLEGLVEMRRVTHAGGVVAVCVWDFAGDRGPLGVFWDAARALWPDTPGESHLPGTREGDLVALMRAAGLENVQGTALPVSIGHSAFADWWEPFTRGAGPAGEFVARLDSHDRARLEQECRRRLPTTPIVVTAAAWSARGIARAGVPPPSD